MPQKYSRFVLLLIAITLLFPGIKSEALVDPQKKETNSRPVLRDIPSESLIYPDMPLFSWTPVDDATGYQVDIWSEDDNANRITVTTQNDSLILNQYLPGGNYLWQVTSYNEKGFGNSSLIGSFTYSFEPIISLQEPQNSARVFDLPRLKWTPVPGFFLYEIQISTKPDFSNTLYYYSTSNNEYQLNDAFANDQDYYWRVRGMAFSGYSEWSETFRFRKIWKAPYLLTPTNQSLSTNRPFFSWTPVEDAKNYRLEIATDSSFSNVVNSFITADNFYLLNTPEALIPGTTYFWRVAPLDYFDQTGPVSQNPYSFTVALDAVSAQPVFPFHYYPPQENLNPHQDWTLAYPVFIWSRAGNSENGKSISYRVEVVDPQNNGALVWAVTTENLAATPTMANPFIYENGKTYNWRVYPVGGRPLGSWTFRIDDQLPVDATTPNEPPIPLYPLNGAESVEAGFLFEWLPVQGATSYQIEISNSHSFITNGKFEKITAEVTQPIYAPVDFPQSGVYFWRVRSIINGQPSEWSAPIRFFYSSPSEWLVERSLGLLSDKNIVASDDVDFPSDMFDLQNLYIASSPFAWYFGFNYQPGLADFGIYLDTMRDPGVGATFDPLGYPIETSDSKPEFAVYIRNNRTRVDLFAWDESNQKWHDQSYLVTDYFDNGVRFEFKLSGDIIGDQYGTKPTSLSVVLFSVQPGIIDTPPVDTIPSQNEEIIHLDPSAYLLEKFISITDRVDAQYIPTTALNRNSNWFSNWKPLFWQPPTSVQHNGYQVQFGVSPEFEIVLADQELQGRQYGYVPGLTTLDRDGQFYWRVRPLYKTSGFTFYGSWSQPHLFVRNGLQVANVEVSSNKGVPTITWDRAEVAAVYHITVCTDPNFHEIVEELDTVSTSWTPPFGFQEGDYFVRVAMRHANSYIENIYSAPRYFAVIYPVPENLKTQIDGNRILLSWNRILGENQSAWRYRVQISTSPHFVPEAIVVEEETELNIFQPTRKLSEGKYYWRVRMVYGNDASGSFSPPQSFEIMEIKPPQRGLYLPMVVR